MGKRKKSDELIIANKELAFQNEEKEKRAAELIITNKELEIEINERKQAEEALHESEERFRSIFENATIGFYRTTPDGEIILANTTLVRILGYRSINELMTRNLEKEGFEPGYQRSEFRRQIERDGEITGLESAWKRKDNTYIYVRESAKVYHDNEGRVLYYEGMVEDITDRKKAEEKINNKVEELERFNKLAVGREMRVIELKQKVNELSIQLGLAQPYKLAYITDLNNHTGNKEVENE